MAGIKRFVQACICFTLVLPGVLQAGPTKVTFLVHADHMLYPQTRIYITGSFNKWSYFDSTYLLKEVSKNNYTIQLTLPADSTVEYKYTLWSPLEMEKGADGSEHPNRRLQLRPGLIQRDTVPRWAVEAVNRGYWKYEEIAPHQQTFIYKNFGKRISEARTPAEIDSLIKDAQLAWAEEVARHYQGSNLLRFGTSPDVPYHPGKQNIGGGGFSPQVYIFFIIDPTKRKVDPVRRKYIDVNYAIPAFLDEYPFLWKNPNPFKAFKIVESVNILSGATSFTLPNELWKGLSKTFDKMPQLIDLYVSRKLYARPDVREALERTQADYLAMRPVWRTLDAMYRGRRDLALALHKSDLLTMDPEVSGQSSWARVGASYRLFAECMEAGEKKQALDLLDFLATSTSDGFLHRDSLKTRYLVADPQGCLRRYEEKVRLRPAFKLAAKDSVTQLRGSYVDALTDSTMRLDSLRGKFVVVDVWTTWCTPCRLELPELKAFVDRVGQRRDVVFLSVNGDGYTGGKSKAELAQVAKDEGLNFPVLVDTPDNSLIQQ